MTNSQARTFLQGVKSRKIRVTPDNSREFIAALDCACLALAEFDDVTSRTRRGAANDLDDRLREVHDHKGRVLGIERRTL